MGMSCPQRQTPQTSGSLVWAAPVPPLAKMVLSVLSPSTSDGRGDFKELWTLYFLRILCGFCTLGIHSFLSLSFFLFYFTVVASLPILDLTF